MKKDWEFDKNFVRSLLKRANELLDSSLISQQDKECLLIDKITFESFLNNNFSMLEEDNEYVNKNLEELINITLRYMEKFYYLIGPDLMDWIIELNKARIFPYFDDELANDFINAPEISKMSMDEQAELTIKNYEKNSKILLPEVKKLIYNTSQIQMVLDDEITSFCHYTEIIRLPFIIVNPNNGFHVLNHEVDHGLHYYLGNKFPHLYSELSPILNELLCIDFYVNDNGKLKLDDFSRRFEDANIFLEEMADFFTLIKEFSKKNFRISYGEFVDACERLILVPEEALKDYLVEEILDDSGIEESMIYTLSYLKALELRQKLLIKKDDIMNILERFMSLKKFEFDINPNSYNIYNNYVDEMLQRVRKR